MCIKYHHRNRVTEPVVNFGVGASEKITCKPHIHYNILFYSSSVPKNMKEIISNFITVGLGIV